MTPRKHRRSVTHRTKGNTLPYQDPGNLAGEPELRELTGMIESGELNASRTQQYLRDQARSNSHD